jgi:pyruvate/2-oxoglutarate dehydrogenase complex dihydrolipoamide dehydrogenase (E3) component
VHFGQSMLLLLSRKSTSVLLHKSVPPAPRLHSRYSNFGEAFNQFKYCTGSLSNPRGPRCGFQVIQTRTKHSTQALPSTMASPTTNKYSAIIIGSGQAGTPLASAFAKAGQRTLLIERAHVGGCCINEGCTPTKTLIASGRAAYLTRRGQDYGIHTSKTGENEVIVDMVKVRQRKRDIVESFRGGSEARLKGNGVEVMVGEASFLDKRNVKVKFSDGSEKIVEGENIFINTGERPVPPKLEGIERVDLKRVLDSTSIQELEEVPRHLVVVGGGYVGVEFAQLMGRLGSQVTILQRGKQLLPREDPEVAEVLFDILKEDGINIYLESTTSSIGPTSDSGFSLKIQSKSSSGASEEHELTGSHILFAAGRVPNTDSLDLPAAGITSNSRSYINASEFLETSAPNIYVLGDVKGPPAFTHISYDDYRILEYNLITNTQALSKRSTKDRFVPYVVYTDPQLGHVGLHETEAREKFPERKIMTAKMPMSYVARALETDESRGMMKAVVDGDTKQILGFTCLGIEGGEVMSVVQMAMMGGVGYDVLQSAIWAHPSLTESLNNLWGFLE